MRKKREILKNILEMSEELPVEKEFLRDLKYSIVKEDSYEKEVSKSYKPSSLHCIRNMYFQIIGETAKNNKSAEFVGICESGTDRHDRLQKAIMNMKSNNIDCEYIDIETYIKSHNVPLEVIEKKGNETKVFSKELNMRFLCDGILRYKGKYYILEIKTETGNKFWSQRDIMPEHILQGTAYSYCFNIDDVIYLYENRDNCIKKTFLLHVTDDMRNKFVEKIKKCNEYVSNGVCPEIPGDLDKKYCGYCNYSESCKKMG